MAEFIHYLQGEMETPSLLSFFHIVVIATILLTTVLISVFFKNCKEKTYKRILLIGWVICIVLEIFKQIIKSFHNGNPSYFEYNFYDFPFHLCSMIFYMLPMLIFLNKDKHKNLIEALNGFISFFGLFAGIVVVFVPTFVFSRLIFTNVQSMVHHGTQVVLGVFIFVWNRKEITTKTYLKSLIVLIITMVLAIGVNLLLYPLSKDGIDMFYINPRQYNNLPIFSTIQRECGYFVYLITYIISISAFGFLTFLTEKGINRLIEKKQ